MDDVEVTLSELKKGLNWGGQRPGLFIVPCGDQALVLALARYLAGQDRLWAPQVLLWLLYGPHCKRPLQDPGAGRLAYECQRALSALVQGMRQPSDLTVLCETTVLAEYYSAMAALKVGVMQGPGLRLETNTSHPRERSDRPTVLCIGHANAGKGYGLLPKAIQTVLELGTNVRFLVHGSIHDCDDPSAEAVMAELRRMSGITDAISVSTDILTPAQYENWFSQADIVLMPYDPLVYASRGSGVLADAQRLGLPAIAPRRCEFAAGGITDGRIVPIETHDADGVAQAVVRAVQHWPSLKARASGFSSGYEDGIGQMLDFHLARAASRARRSIGKWHQ